MKKKKEEVSNYWRMYALLRRFLGDGLATRCITCGVGHDLHDGNSLA